MTCFEICSKTLYLSYYIAGLKQYLRSQKLVCTYDFFFLKIAIIEVCLQTENISK